MTARTADLAGRGLAFTVRLLPERREEWGEAMLAELVVIESPRQRRRHALGCFRAVVGDPGVRGPVSAAVCVLVVSTGTIVLSLLNPMPLMRIEMVVCVLVLAACCLASRRRGLLGPVGDGRPARRVRTFGCWTVAICLVMFALPPGPHDPSGWWIAGAVLVVDLVAVLAVTAHADATTIRLSGFGALGATSAWWLLMLVGPGVRANPQLAFIAVAMAAIFSIARVQAATGDTRSGFVAGLGAAAATCLMIFLVAVGTYAVAPGLVPDVSGPYCCAGGLTRADRDETNRRESTDPYVADLIVGALLAAGLVLAVGSRRTNRKQVAAPDAEPGSCRVC